MSDHVLLSARHVVKDFSISSGLQKRHLYAVNDVSLDIYRGETLGVVGESGCGKSTLGRTLLRLIPRTSGEVFFDGQDVYAANKKELLNLRRRMQIVFQDPAASLNPRMKVGQIVSEPLRFHEKLGRAECLERARKMLDMVHLAEGAEGKYPHEFSGGQQQRIGIARALITNPEFLVCDEAVSALDVSVQAQILNLLSQLKEQMNLTCLFISHNLSVIRHISDRIAVMYMGEIVELGTTEQIFEKPLHPYTRLLLASIPSVSKGGRHTDRSILNGELPDLMNLPSGCRFCTRCADKKDTCITQRPILKEAEPGHYVACMRSI